MVSSRVRVVHVGPAAEAQGGIASVIRTLSRSSLVRLYDVRFIATASHGRPFGRLRDFVGLIHAAATALAPTRHVLHVHMASQGSYLRKALVIRLARLRGHRVVLHLHGAEFHRFAGSAGPLLSRGIRRTFTRADTVIVLSSEWRQRVGEFGGRDDCVVVPNPVLLPARTDPAAERRRAGVAFLGRLGTRKGVPELLSAAEILARRGSRVRVVAAGDGDAEPWRRRVLEGSLNGLVDFPGWLSDREVNALLEQAAVFALPSHDEGKPVALLEAMAHGVACIATPVGGIPDVLKEGRNGLIVPVGDAEALADAIESLLSDQRLRERLGAAARKTIEDEYEVEKVVARLCNIYTSLGFPPAKRSGEAAA